MLWFLCEVSSTRLEVPGGQECLCTLYSNYLTFSGRVQYVSPRLGARFNQPESRPQGAYKSTQRTISTHGGG